MSIQLFNGTKQEAFKSILQLSQEKGYAIINYLYFANAMKYRLFEHSDNQIDRDFASSLQVSDILLPDGIALQLFSKYYLKEVLSNLNGTDFLPYFLKQLQIINYPFSLFLYGSKSEYIPSIVEYFEKNQMVVMYAQDGYTEFQWNALPQQKSETLNILLVGRGTPLQENRAFKNIDKIKKQGFLVMNQGGTFDFLINQEIRAPKRIIKARVLETFWRIVTNPKKNLPKFISMFGIIRRFFAKKKLSEFID